MSALLALLPVLIPVLAQLPGDIAALISWIGSIKTAAQQSNEWTAAQEGAFQTLIASQAATPAQEPDMPVTLAPPVPATPAPIVTSPPLPAVAAPPVPADAFVSARSAPVVKPPPLMSPPDAFTTSRPAK